MAKNPSKTLKQRFIDECYNGDKKAYFDDRNTDYVKAKLKWADWFNKNVQSGKISAEELKNAGF